MTIQSLVIKSQVGSVERVLLQRGFDRIAFLRAADLVKDRARRAPPSARDAATLVNAQAASAGQVCG